MRALPTRLEAAERAVVEVALGGHAPATSGTGGPDIAAKDWLRDLREAADRVRDLREGSKTIEVRDLDMLDVYPTTVILDRYSGAYSGGTWVAWGCDVEYVPREPSGGDGEAMQFWDDRQRETRAGVSSLPAHGVGHSPEEAVIALDRKQRRKIPEET